MKFFTYVQIWIFIYYIRSSTSPKSLGKKPNLGCSLNLRTIRLLLLEDEVKDEDPLSADLKEGEPNAQTNETLQNEYLQNEHLQNETVQSETLENGGLGYSGLQYNGLENSGLQYNGLENSGLQYNGLENSGLQYNGLENSGLQYSGLENSGLQYNGLENSGLQYNGLENSGLQYNGLENSGFQYNGLENSGLQYNGLENNGLGYSGLEYSGLENENNPQEHETQPSKFKNKMGGVFVFKKIPLMIEENLFKCFASIYDYIDKDENSLQRKFKALFMMSTFLLITPIFLISLIGAFLIIGQDTYYYCGTALCYVISITIALFIILKNLKYRAIKAGHANPSFKDYFSSF
ncbi:lysophospholipase, putative [Plasmodium malariae]|uniref:Lysophospholipase, putative n=1 Tax=Plasmodium malariae TaxID=5858 RepID=A0A1D3JIB1_PLAMA|nr:lysophospholipase, putative [Plasmodium malariae]SBT86177.1 lysophospholipase, putative [Plasmodium malariae]